MEGFHRAGHIYYPGAHKPRMYILKTGGGIVESLYEAGTSTHSMPANARGSRGMPPRKISYENQIASLSETCIWGHSVLD